MSTEKIKENSQLRENVQMSRFQGAVPRAWVSQLNNSLSIPWCDTVVLPSIPLLPMPLILLLFLSSLGSNVFEPLLSPVHFTNPTQTALQVGRKRSDSIFCSFVSSQEGDSRTKVSETEQSQSLRLKSFFEIFKSKHEP